MKISVLGCGRSGTNWIAHALSKEIPVAIETEPTFSWSVHSAIYDTDFARLIAKYKEDAISVKDHANIWFAERLEGIFNFIAVERDVKQVVASSLLHEGVQHWVKYYHRYPPNGLSGTIIDPDFSKYTTTEKLTLRWIAHHNRLRELERNLDSLLVLDYNEMVLTPEIAESKIFEFSGIDVKLNPKKNTIHKWKRLSTKDLTEINRTLDRWL